MKDSDNHQETGMARESFISMAVSLLLVGSVLLFVFSFKYFLNGQKYHGKAAAEVTTAVSRDSHREYLDTDKKFKAGYIMIKNVTDKGFYASEEPGRKEGEVQQLKNGQILYASKKGTCNGKVYYHLKNGLYMRANEQKTEELSSYEKLTGYVVITYISSSGVRVRSWANFDDDNVVKSVFVGDKVYIKGKVITKDGSSAYITSEGLYLTTNIRYLNDYTAEIPQEENTSDSENANEVQDTEAAGE